MSYSACDFADDILREADASEVPQIDRENWNRWTGSDYAADDWPPGDSGGLAVLSYRAALAFLERRDLLALLRDIREFWTGGDCPPELCARIEAATGAAP